MQFNAGNSIQQSLKLAQSESARVVVHLQGGAELHGRVEDVGERHVVVAELSGKEFYDALVRIDSIVAIEARVRDR